MEFFGTMDPGLLLIIIGVLFLVGSMLFGWMIFYVVRSREKKAPRPSPTSLPSLPSATPPVADERVAEVSKDKKTEPPLREQFATLSQVGRRASAAPVEVMRLLRDRVTGALVVEVEGERYRALREIQDGQVGRQVLQAAADLVRFTEVMRFQRQTRTRQPSHPSGSEPSPTVVPPAPSTLALKVAPAVEQESPVPRTPAPPAVEREFLASLSQQVQQEEVEPEKVSMNPIEFFRRGFAARRTARAQGDTSSPRSFVEEIEDILQRFVRTYPSFIGKEVHVGTGPDGGIRIQVEDEAFDTPDDIPDPEIRGIIKAAIQEWEKS